MKIVRFAALLLLVLTGCSSVVYRLDTRATTPVTRRVAMLALSDVTLLISLTNLVNQSMCYWEPLTPPAPEGTGSGSTHSTNYTGMAVMLKAVGLNATNGCFIECSNDLMNWLAYPSAGFQLTLIMTNATSMIPMYDAAAFYRGRIAPVNF